MDSSQKEAVNKIIFNLDELFISVGIDVGADFSWMSIALPNQQLVANPYISPFLSEISISFSVSVSIFVKLITFSSFI